MQKPREEDVARVVAGMAPPNDKDSLPSPASAARHDMPLERCFRLHGQATVRNTDRPTLIPVLPDGAAIGAAVVIATGGGYLIA